MKNFIFNYKDSEGNEKEVALRLNSISCENIEKQYNCSILNFVQQGSMTAIITLLQKMREGSGEVFTRNSAYAFYDELVDAGYSMADVLDKIICEALVVSGIISEEDLKSIREEREKIKNMTPEEKEKLIEERKNAQK